MAVALPLPLPCRLPFVVLVASIAVRSSAASNVFMCFLSALAVERAQDLVRARRLDDVGVEAGLEGRGAIAGLAVAGHRDQARLVCR